MPSADGAPPRRRGPGDRRTLLGVAVAAVAYLVLLHRPPGVLWFDFAQIVHRFMDVPLSGSGLVEAIRWQVTSYVGFWTRPLRAVEWWLAVNAFGCDALGYYVANVVLLAAGIAAAVWLGRRLGDDPSAGMLLGACVAVSYTTVFFLLFLGYTLGMICAFAGLAAYLQSETGSRRRPWQALAIVLLVGAILVHETYLVFPFLPVLHAALVQRSWPAARRAVAILVVLPVYVVVRALETAVAGTQRALVGGLMPATVIPALENPARVLYEILTGGLPFDPIRVLPWLGEYVRIHEWLATPAGLVTAMAIAAPGAVLTVLGARRTFRASPRLGAFLVIWLAMSTLPLMLPSAPAEPVHLAGALPALFMFWPAALRRAGAARRPAMVAWALFVLWIGIHGAARAVLFHGDVPAMSRAVEALHPVLRAAEATARPAGVLFFPKHIGAHYGMMPAVPVLYPASEGRACVRGPRQTSCLVEPVWIWSALGAPPRLPRACRRDDGILAGPLDAGEERVLHGTRKMLAHWGVTLHAADPLALGTCPLAGVEPVTLNGRRYVLYRVADAEGRAWYRFSADGGASLVPVPKCAGGEAG